MRSVLWLAVTAVATTTGAAELRPLPVVPAPFEPTGKARQSIEVLTWNYKSWAFAPDNEYLVWAELRAGDRSVLAQGEDKRVRKGGGSGAGSKSTTGFGRVAVYAGKRAAQKPGDILLESIRLLGPGEDPKADYKDARDDIQVDRDAKKVTWRRTLNGKTYGYEVFATGAGKVAVEYDAAMTATPVDVATNMMGVTVKIVPPAGKRRGRIAIDLGESAAARFRGTPPTSGVDFWSTDALHVPVKTGRNLLTNPGFEQRMKSWCDPNGNHQIRVDELEQISGGKPLTGITTDARTGRYAMYFKSKGGTCEPVYSHPVPIFAGRTYTASFWVKGNSSACYSLEVLPPDFYHKRITYQTVKCANPGNGKTGPEWNRVTKSFTSTGNGVVLGIRSWTDCDLVIDDFQLEEGDTATDFDPNPAEADLLLSREWNFQPLGEKMNARLALSGRPNLKGEVKVTVSDFYSETLFKKTVPFALDGKGLAEAKLDLDSAIAESGMFFVRYTFKADGKLWYDYSRFEVAKPLEGKHPTARFFGIFDENWCRSGLAPELSDRVKALGWGVSTHISIAGTTKGRAAEYMHRAGVVPVLHTVGHEMARFYPGKFGWATPDFRPFTNVCPEKIRMVYDSAYRCGLECATNDVWWALSNEEELSIPVLKKNRDYDTWAHYQKAAYDGLKKAFDERGLRLLYGPSHGVVGGSKDGGVKALEGYITAAEKLGLKYDFVGVHQAWALDGASIGSWSGRETNLDDLEEMLARHGMQDCYILHPENFYMLAQYIPSWGSIDWCDSYQGTLPTHALGNREFFHAGLLARAFVTDLKRYPRLALNHPWMQRFVIDRQLSPSCWGHVANTFGHLLPDPRFVGWAMPLDCVRGYVFRQGDHGVLAVWTTDNDVEMGVKRGPVLQMDLPPDARYFDLMGVERRGDGRNVPLTCAPIFIVAKESRTLLVALETAKCPDLKPAKTRTFAAPQPQVEVRRCGASGPDWTKVAPLAGCADAGRGIVKMAWNDEALFIRIEAKDRGVVRIGFDGIADARKTRARGLGPDDSVYDFSGATIRRVKCVNTQFADDTTQAASDEEVVRDFRRAFTPNAAGGGVWEIAVVPRFLTPTRLEPGSKAGFGFAAVQSGEEPDLGDPVDWTLLELK